MNDYYPYYEALAERTFFEGLYAEDVGKIGKYKNGKDFRDLINATRQGKLEGLDDLECELDCIASKMRDVLEIDTSIPFKNYEKRLKSFKSARK